MFVSTMFYRRETSSIGPLQFSDNSLHDSDVEVADQLLTPILMSLIILTTQIEVAKQVYNFITHTSPLVITLLITLCMPSLMLLINC